jgi:VIT1/CCC1 family predicted Fe2+/Mn2+ transporter
MELYKNWREEKRSAYLYGIMEKCEHNHIHKKLFFDLKEAANKQAFLWEEKINAASLPAPIFKPAIREKLVACLITWIGTERLHHILSAMKIRGMSVFTHYHSEHKHISLGTTSNLRAAVFGMHDGLISNISLILGVAGAQANHHFIIITGLTGLLAGACSMGAGEYISVRSQRDVFEYQIQIEKQELALYPEEERQELSLIYQARGIPPQEAAKLSKIMIDNPDTALNTLAREELGINPEEMVSPIGAMLSSFFSFAIGAFVPLFPFTITNASWSLPLSISLTATVLFILGAVLSLFSNRHPVWLGIRMLAIGLIAGSITFTAGRLLGT